MLNESVADGFSGVDEIDDLQRVRLLRRENVRIATGMSRGQVEEVPVDVLRILELVLIDHLLQILDVTPEDALQVLSPLLSNESGQQSSPGPWIARLTSSRIK